MVDKGYEALARRIVGLEQRLESFSHTRQLGNSSVTLADGSDASVSGGVGAGNDAQHAIASIDDTLTDVDEINDAEVEHSVSVPEWIENAGTDVAWDSSQYAAALAAQLETELGEAQADLDQALADATTALSEAGLARSEAAEAVSDAADAVAQATQAIQDALAASVKADGVNTFSDRVPVAGDAEGKPVGAAWFVRDTGGISQVWELTSLGWVERPLEEAIIPKVAIGEGTYGELSGGRIVAGSIVTEKLDALAVTAAKLAAGAVTAVKIAAEAVTTEKIAAGAVTANEIAALAITAEKLAVASITAEKIAAGAITTGKLAADAIDGMTITGALIRTAPTGQRLELNEEGLVSYGLSGEKTSTLNADSGGMHLYGAMVTGPGGYASRNGINFITEYATRGPGAQVILAGRESEDGRFPSVTARLVAQAFSGSGSSMRGNSSYLQLGNTERESVRLGFEHDYSTGIPRAVSLRTQSSGDAPPLDMNISASKDMTLYAKEVQIRSDKLSTYANLFSSLADLEAWDDAFPGTRAWVDNREYVRVNGQWRPLPDLSLDDLDWVDISSSITSAYRATCVARRSNGLIEILFDSDTNTIPTGTTVLGTVPLKYRPDRQPNRRGAAFMAGGNTGVFYVTPDGEFGISQQSGAARRYCQGHMVFAAFN